MTGIESPVPNVGADWQDDLTDALLKDSVRFGEGEFKREGGLRAPYEIALEDPCSNELTTLCVTALATSLADLAEVKGAKYVVAMPGMPDGVVDGIREVFDENGLSQRFIRYRSDMQAARRGVPRMTWDDYRRNDSVVVLATCIDDARANNILQRRLSGEDLEVLGAASLIDTGEFLAESRRADVPRGFGMIGALPLARVLDRALEQGIIDDGLHRLCTEWPQQA